VKKLELDSLVIDKERHEVKVDGELVELTFKEYELLNYLTINKGIVLRRDQIMERIWGIDYEGESRTLDMHIKTLRRKLGDFGSRIRTVRNVGYVIE
jgi:two-component system alkaline phosphatase synthesis response regulator PhoP